MAVGRVYYPRAKVILDFFLDPFDSGREPLLATTEAIPRSIEIERNTLRSADTCTLELDYRDFPFDPRTITSCLVAASMGDIKDPNGKLSKRSRSFIGFVDAPKTKLDEGGEFVTFSCRDYTGLFLDTPFDTSKPLRLDRSLFLLMQDVLERVPGTEGLPVVFDPELTATVVLDSRIGRSKWIPKERKKVDMWTALVELLGSVALIPVIVLDELRIVQAGAFGNPTPSTFQYGRNLKSLQFERKTRETRTKQILVRSWDQRTRTAREALFPEEPIVVRQVKNKNGKVRKDFANILPFTVDGPYSVAELREIAERIYNDAARNQIEGSFETGEMTDLTNATVLGMSNGDTVSLLLGKDERASIAGLGLTEAVELLTTGPDAMTRDVARALVLAFRRADTLATKFYVTTATHKFTRDEGYSLRATFQNFAGEGR